VAGSAGKDGVVAVHNLRDYFRESIGAAIENQGVDVDPHAAQDRALVLHDLTQPFHQRHQDCHLFQRLHHERSSMAWFLLGVPWRFPCDIRANYHDAS